MPPDAGAVRQAPLDGVTLESAEKVLRCFEAMSVFLSALNAVVPHVRVRGHTLLLSQGHPFTTVEFDLRRLAAHKQVSPTVIRLRSLRGRWTEFSLDGFRPAEIRRLRGLLDHWEQSNHAPRHQEP